MNYMWYTIKYRYMSISERLIRVIVWQLPRRVVYWAAIRALAHATTGKYGTQIVPELMAMDVLKRWDR